MKPKQTFLQLAKALQPHSSRIEPLEYPPTLLNQVHIPPKFEQFLYQQNKEKPFKLEKKEIETLKQPKSLEPKKARQFSELNTTKRAQVSRDKKQSRMDYYLQEIIQSSALANALQIDKWQITRMVLGSNEKNCFVYWKLDQGYFNNSATLSDSMEIEEILKAYEGIIQKRLISMVLRNKKTSPLKYVPRIKFQRDKGLEEQEKLVEIFNKIKSF